MNSYTEILLQELLTAHLKSLNEKTKKEEEMQRVQFLFHEYKLANANYHTWMNYYSLFNGALLVAYCTILVSTGEIVKNGEGIQMAMSRITGEGIFASSLDTVSGVAYSLNCTYWDYLLLIAVVGILAALFWYFSLKGHVCWLNSWREGIYQAGYERMLYTSDSKLSFQRTEDFKWLPGFYSTSKITGKFVLCVLAAWCILLIITLNKMKIFTPADVFLNVIVCYLIPFLIVGGGLYCLSQSNIGFLMSDLSLCEMKRTHLSDGTQAAIYQTNQHVKKNKSKWLRRYWCLVFILVNTVALILFTTHPLSHDSTHIVLLSRCS